MDPRIFGPTSPTVGDTIDGVYWMASDGVGHRIPDGKLFHFSGMSLPDDGKVSIYGATIEATGEEMIQTSLGEQAWWRSAPAQDDQLTPHIVELYAGMGGMGMGAAVTGGRAILSVDYNDLAFNHLKVNKHGEAMKLDITGANAAKRIHMALPQEPVVAMMGFPCQPHSTQGRQMGFGDKRATTFWHGLRTIFQVQCQAAVLECVPGQGTTRWSNRD